MMTESARRCLNEVAARLEAVMASEQRCRDRAFATEFDPLVVNYGGGDNSLGLLCGLAERGIRPDLILFTDPGNEMPHTTESFPMVRAFLERVGFPPLETTRRVITRGVNKGRVHTLEEECWANETLPAKAFGRPGCSVKWKVQPGDKFVRAWFRGHIRGGGMVRRCIGYDIGEVRRCKFQPTPPWRWEYPLVDWRWTREDCQAAIRRMGMDPPGKSACFFCPSTKKPEMRRLADQYPELHRRALEMEAMAQRSGKLREVVGLGRHWSWQNETERHRRQLTIVYDGDEDMPCGAECGT